MAQYCFDDKDAAKASIAADNKRLRVYDVNCPKLQLRKFVVSPSAELAIARVSTEFGGFVATTGNSKAATEKAALPSRKEIDQLMTEAAAATDPVVMKEKLQKAASLREQLDAARKAKKTAAAGDAAQTPPAPPMPV